MCVLCVPNVINPTFWFTSVLKLPNATLSGREENLFTVCGRIFTHLSLVLLKEKSKERTKSQDKTTNNCLEGVAVCMVLERDKTETKREICVNM